MKYTLLSLLLIISTISFAQNSNKHNAKPKEKEVVTALLDSFDVSVLKDVEAKEMVGAAYIVYQNGQIIRKKVFGEADMNAHRPMQTNSIFRLASMTKPIASLAMLLLQEDGKINMNDRLEQYLPDFKNLSVVDKIDSLNGTAVLTSHTNRKPILLRHLLTHTAGFASQYGGNLGGIYLATFTNPSVHDLKYYAEQLAHLPLGHEPGDGWVYGPSINIAARVIEVVTGMPFQDFVQKRIFDPLGMNDTKFYYDASYAERLTTQYGRDNNGKIIVVDNGDATSKLINGPKVYYSASGGLNSTLEDYLKFCLMVMNNGELEGKKIAKPETISMMKVDQVPLNINAILPSQSSDFNEGFTFGYQIQRKDNNPSRTLGTISWLGATGPLFFIDTKRI